MIEVIWKCPSCGTRNVDDFSETIFPFCEYCVHEVRFEDLLSHHQYTYVNALLAANLSGYVDVTRPRFYSKMDDQYNYNPGEELFHVFERGRLNEFDEPYCVQPFLSYKEAELLVKKLNESGGLG